MADGLTELMAVMKLLQALGGQPNPDAANQVDQGPITIEMPKSLADAGRLVLKCYHPTGRFHAIDVLEKPWQRQQRYNADGSILVRISWYGGIVGNRYQTDVAFVARGNEFTAPVMRDSAYIEPNPRCPYNGWVTVNLARTDTAASPTAINGKAAVSRSAPVEQSDEDEGKIPSEIYDLINAAEKVAAGGPTAGHDAEAIPTTDLADLARKALAARRSLEARPR